MINQNHISKFSHYFFILVCLFGIIIRLYPDGESMWLDELYSVTHAYSWDSFGSLFFGEMIYETHPPIYQTLLYFWVKVAGTSDYMVRFPSAVFGVASILIILVYGKKTIGKNQALLLAALISVSWGAIQYAHEARNYSLLLMLSVILMLQSQNLSTHYRKIIIPKRLLTMLFITGLFSCYTHYFGALIYFSSLAALFIFLKPARKQLFILAIISFLVFAPWLITNLIYYEPAKVAWIEFNPISEYLIFYNFFILYSTKLTLILGVFILILIILQSTKGRQNIGHQILLPLIIILITIGIAFAISIIKPIMDSRYLIVTIPYFYFIMVTIFSEPLKIRLSNQKSFIKMIPLVFSMVMLSLMLFLSVKVFKNFEKPDWRGAAQTIREIDNVDTIYCLRNPQYFYHYLRNSNVKKQQLVRSGGIKSLHAPQQGMNSIVWGVKNIRGYHIIKNKMKDQGFSIKYEKICGKDPVHPSPSNNSRFLVFE